MTRATVQTKVEIAWQKQLRDRYDHEGAPATDLSVKRAIVRPVSRQLATRIILKYEWLGTMHSSTLHYGIFFGPYCGGVTCVVANGAGSGSTNTHIQYGVARDQLCVLARGACVHWAPPRTNSKLVAWTMKHLAKHGLKVCIAFADTDAGEIGTIYQATNWTYAGRSAQSQQLVSKTGRVLHYKTYCDWVKKSGRSHAEYKRRIIAAGWRFEPANPKHKYAFLLDRSDPFLVERFDALAKPYPKRDDARAPESSTSLVPLGSGRGSTDPGAPT